VVVVEPKDQLHCPELVVAEERSPGKKTLKLYHREPIVTVKEVEDFREVWRVPERRNFLSRERLASFSNHLCA
jgi:hypothetical protein